jgi:hypothetical protein
MCCGRSRMRVGFRRCSGGTIEVGVKGGARWAVAFGKCAPQVPPRHAPRHAGTGGMTKARAGPGLVPHLRRSHCRLSPSPSGLGSRFGCRPSGPRIHGDCSVISFSTCKRQVALPTACSKARRDRRDDKGWGGASMRNWLVAGKSAGRLSSERGFLCLQIIGRLLPASKLKCDGHTVVPQFIGVGAIVHGSSHDHPSYA